MAGHSHWAGIKHKKAANDAKRGKLFGKLGKAVTIAARDGADPAFNHKLRSAIDQARAAGMPKENIERAVKKGAGGGDAGGLVTAAYEAYGPGGVAMVIECLTDNINRTFPEVRKILEAHGGKLGGAGSVAWMFHRKALVSVRKQAADEETFMEVAVAAGADDVADAEDTWEIIAPPDALEAAKAALAERGITAEVAEVTLIADNEVQLDDETAARVLALMNALDEHDDVQNVYASFTPTAAQAAGLRFET